MWQSAEQICALCTLKVSQTRLCRQSPRRRKPSGSWGKAPNRWAIFVSFSKNCQFNVIQIRFCTSLKPFYRTTFQTFITYVDEKVNCSLPSASLLLTGWVRNTFKRLHFGGKLFGRAVLRLSLEREV